jgi:putative tricarboxylic transport membrane protein
MSRATLHPNATRILAWFGTVGIALQTGVAPAQQWKPTRNVELVSASAAGSASDTGLRLIERMLHERKLIDVSTTVVNKPGGGGNIGWTYANQQAPDGHTLTLVIGNIISNQIIGRSTLAYTDLTCVSQLFSEYTAVGVRADSPVKDARDLLARLKADSGSLSAAIGTAFGGSGHIALALATKDAGGEPKKLRAVVFPGFSQGLAAVYGGHVDLVANPHSSFLGPVREGKLRLLAVAAPQRLSGELANVPTWKELGVDAELEAFRAMAGPKGLPAAQVAYWEDRFRALSESAEWKEMLAKRAWVNRYANHDGCTTGFKRQYDQMRRGLQELGLAKN